MSSWIKIVVPLNVSLNYISCLDLDCLSRSLSYRFASCCFQSFVNIARKCRVYQMNIVFYLEVKCTRKWFWDLFFITSVSSHSQQLARKFGAWQNSGVAGRTGDFGNWIKLWFFRTFLPKAHFYPAYYMQCNGRLTWLNSPNGEFSISKRFIFFLLFNFLLKGSVCFHRP